MLSASSLWCLSRLDTSCLGSPKSTLRSREPKLCVLCCYMQTIKRLREPRKVMSNGRRHALIDLHYIQLVHKDKLIMPLIRGLFWGNQIVMSWVPQFNPAILPSYCFAFAFPIAQWLILVATFVQYLEASPNIFGLCLVYWGFV